MFEDIKTQERSALWKILPVAVLIFGAIAAMAIYLSDGESPPSQELTGVLTEGSPEFERYRHNIELVNERIQMGLNIAGNRIVMISGIIENRGERELDVVQIKVTFFNYQQPVEEVTRTPIQPGPYTSSVAPLGKTPFDFYVEEIPQDWLATTAELSLQGFRFKEE